MAAERIKATGKVLFFLLVVGAAVAAAAWFYRDADRRDRAELVAWAGIFKSIEADRKTQQANVCAKLTGPAAATCTFENDDRAAQRRAEGLAFSSDKRDAIWRRVLSVASLASIPVFVIGLLLLWLSAWRAGGGQRTSAPLLVIVWSVLVFILIIGGTAWLGYRAYGEDRSILAGRGAADAAVAKTLKTRNDEVCQKLFGTAIEACRTDLQQRSERRRQEEARLMASRQSALWSRTMAVSALALFPFLVSGMLLLLLAPSRRREADDGDQLLALAEAASRVPVATSVPATAAVPPPVPQAAGTTGQLQVRAYLQVVHAVAEFYGEWVNISVRLRNSGQSPALRIVVTATIQALESEALKEDALRVSSPSSSLPVDIGSRETREAALVIHVSQLSAEVYKALSDRTAAFELAGSISWSDVFSEREALTFMMREGEAQHYALSQAVRREAQILLIPFYDA